jgi:hypothetical protein
MHGLGVKVRKLDFLELLHDLIAALPQEACKLQAAFFVTVDMTSEFVILVH